MKWSREELNASVKVYIQMRDLELCGEKFTKKSFYHDLSERFGRSPKSFEFRMQNISHVYSLMGRHWIKGLKPAKNVGKNILPVIEELILQNEGLKGVPIVEFEEQVSKLRQEEDLPHPEGKLQPKQQTATTSCLERDPKVVAWILKNSEGQCESCSQAAPFQKDDGKFYLEVHHLKRLADGGSDRTSNAVAVCPNCHRELHYGSRRTAVLEKLYSKISRLKRE